LSGESLVGGRVKALLDFVVIELPLEHFQMQVVGDDQALQGVEVARFDGVGVGQERGLGRAEIRGRGRARSGGEEQGGKGAGEGHGHPIPVRQRLAR